MATYTSELHPRGILGRASRPFQTNKILKIYYESKMRLGKDDYPFASSPVELESAVLKALETFSPEDMRQLSAVLKETRESVNHSTEEEHPLYSCAEDMLFQAELETPIFFAAKRAYDFVHNLTLPIDALRGALYSNELDKSLLRKIKKSGFATIYNKARELYELALEIIEGKDSYSELNRKLRSFVESLSTFEFHGKTMALDFKFLTFEELDDFDTAVFLHECEKAQARGGKDESL